jgi:hypothetical protein
MIALNQDLIMNTQANPNATAGQAASATSNDNFIDVSPFHIAILDADDSSAKVRL